MGQVRSDQTGVAADLISSHANKTNICGRDLEKFILLCIAAENNINKSGSPEPASAGVYREMDF